MQDLDILKETLKKYKKENYQVMSWPEYEVELRKLTDKVVRYVKQNKHQLVKNYLLRVDNQHVGFCGLIGLVKENLAYFHNVGVLPEFRRRGYFTSIIQHLTNETKLLDLADTYALVEQDSGSYHGLIKLGYDVVDKYHLFSTV